MKEGRPGWKWVEVGEGGYWSKVTGESHKHKKDFFCKHCGRPTGTIDDEYTEKYGICRTCYTLYIEDRKTPAIDLSKYKK